MSLCMKISPSNLFCVFHRLHVLERHRYIKLPELLSIVQVTDRHGGCRGMGP